jgi:ABC-2 type transport system permease protein
MTTLDPHGSGAASTTATRPGSPAAAGPDRAGDGEVVPPAWFLVARREVVVKATDRTFLIGTVVTLGIIAGLITLQIVLSQRTKHYTVAAGPAAVQLANAVRDGAHVIDDKVAVKVRQVPDDTAARAAVAGGSADAWLHRQGGSWLLTSKSKPQDNLEAVTREVVRDATVQANAVAAGTSLEALQRGSALQTSLLQGDAKRADLVGIVGFAFAFLFYLASLMFGIALANSVLEEKQSRIVEIIATAIPVRQLLAGKVLGNTVLAVLQLTLFVAAGLIGLGFTDYSGLVPAISGPVVWFVVFFLAGFVALACLWAVAGSLASRTEDLQATTTPLTMLVMAVLFGGLLLDGTAKTVGSFVPPLSAVVMPIRLLEGDTPWWQGLIALALLLGSAAVTVMLGERIYRRSLLQTGGRVSLRKAWRSAD